MAPKSKKPVVEAGLIEDTIGSVLTSFLPDKDDIFKSDKAEVESRKPAKSGTPITAKAAQVILTTREVLVVKETYRKGTKELWYRCITNPDQIARWGMVPVRFVVKSAGAVVYRGLALNDAVKAYDSLV